MPTLFHTNRDASFVPSIDRVERKASRLGALLNMGGTLENGGATLHIVGLRINVASIADMNEVTWCKAARNIIESLGPERRMQAARANRVMNE